LNEKEKKQELYRKELWMTFLFILLFFMMCYTIFIFIIFPDLKGGFILGFPIHYAIPLFFGWPGMIVATLIYVKLGTKFDEEMEEFTAEIYDSAETNREEEES